MTSTIMILIFSCIMTGFNFSALIFDDSGGKQRTAIWAILTIIAVASVIININNVLT